MDFVKLNGQVGMNPCGRPMMGKHKHMPLQSVI
jgi:hypothetical protein